MKVGVRRGAWEALRSRPRGWKAIAAWFVLVGVLGTIGLGVGDRLHRSNILVPGSKAAAAQAADERAFGPSNPLLVLVEGPPSVLDREGPQIAHRLSAVANVTVVSPWSAASRRAL